MKKKGALGTKGRNRIQPTDLEKAYWEKYKIHTDYAYMFIHIPKCYTVDKYFSGITP